MKIILTALSLALVLWSCSGSTDPNDPWANLTEPAPFVGAILVPPEHREWRQEIFVGKVIPNEEAPPVILGEDSVLQRVLYTVRNRYFAEVVGNPNATVLITDENGVDHEFVHDRNGYYVDVDGSLTIVPGGEYHLKVKSSSDTYEGSVVVPGDFAWEDPLQGDTVVAVPDPSLAHAPDVPAYEFHWSTATGAEFYQMRARKSDFYDVIYSMNYSFGKLGLLYPGELNTTWYSSNTVELYAIDPNYAQLFHAGGPFNGGPEWTEWYDVQAAKSLKRRSTITGSDDITGVFGAATRAKVSFVVEATR